MARRSPRIRSARSGINESIHRSLSSQSRPSPSEMNSRIVKFIVLRISKLSPAQKADTSFVSSARLWEPQYQLEHATVCCVDKGIEIFLHQDIGVAFKISPFIRVYETRCGDFSARRERSKLPDFTVG